MAERLAEGERARAAAEAARRQLVAAVSHDLRTPIASLRLLVEAVDDDIVDERDPPPLPGDDADPHRLAQRDDRRPLRALADRGRRHRLVDAPGRAGAAGRRDGRGDAARGARPPRSRSAPSSTTPRCRPRRPGEDPARALQPDPQRDPPHARRRQRHRARRGRGRGGRDRGGRHRRRHPGRGARSASSTPSTAAARRPRAARDGAGLGLAISPRDRRDPRRPHLAARSERGTRVRFSLPREPATA